MNYHETKDFMVLWNTDKYYHKNATASLTNMRHFSYYNYSESNVDDIATFSEKEIFDNYYPYWCFLMKKKYLTTGKNPPTEEVLCFDHCLNDWITTNYAWEIKT